MRRTRHNLLRWSRHSVLLNISHSAYKETRLRDLTARSGRQLRRWIISYSTLKRRELLYENSESMQARAEPETEDRILHR